MKKKLIEQLESRTLFNSVVTASITPPNNVIENQSITVTLEAENSDVFGDPIVDANVWQITAYDTKTFNQLASFTVTTANATATQCTLPFTSDEGQVLLQAAVTPFCSLDATYGEYDTSATIDVADGNLIFAQNTSINAPEHTSADGAVLGIIYDEGNGPASDLNCFASYTNTGLQFTPDIGGDASGVDPNGVVASGYYVSVPQNSSITWGNIGDNNAFILGFGDIGGANTDGGAIATVSDAALDSSGVGNTVKFGAQGNGSTITIGSFHDADPQSQPASNFNVQVNVNSTPVDATITPTGNNNFDVSITHKFLTSEVNFETGTIDILTHIADTSGDSTTDFASTVYMQYPVFSANYTVGAGQQNGQCPVTGSYSDGTPYNGLVTFANDASVTYTNPTVTMSNGVATVLVNGIDIGEGAATATAVDNGDTSSYSIINIGCGQNTLYTYESDSTGGEELDGIVPGEICPMGNAHYIEGNLIFPDGTPASGIAIHVDSNGSNPVELNGAATNPTTLVTDSSGSFLVSVKYKGPDNGGNVILVFQQSSVTSTSGHDFSNFDSNLFDIVSPTWTVTPTSFNSTVPTGNFQTSLGLISIHVEDPTTTSPIAGEIISTQFDSTRVLVVGGSVTYNATDDSGNATLSLLAPGSPVPATVNTNVILSLYGTAVAPLGVSVTINYVAMAPAINGAPTINGDNPNGLNTASGQPSSGVQRSMVEDVVYTFNEPVTISDVNQAFVVTVANNSIGVAPSSIIATSIANPSTGIVDGTTWAISLTGQSDGVLASIANGEYTITVHPSYIFSALDNTPMAGSAHSDNFYRLFGDLSGQGVLTALDSARFKQALTVYNPLFDYIGNGSSIIAIDNARFKQALSINFVGDGFVPTI